MRRKRKTKLEIINETAAYYSKDTSRRAFSSNDSCQYLTIDGRMCAVGRCFTSKGLKTYGDIMGSYDCDMHKLMRVEYSHIDDECFWIDLQNFHDGHSYWNKRKGLTVSGKRCLAELRAKYTLQ